MKLLALILLTLFVLPVLSQTTYYVKNGGNDELSGTSDANAWASISKFNSTAFVAGDSILFKRGDSWNNLTLILSNEDGTEASPIYIGAYGTGARPIIDLRDTIPGWTVAGNWTDQGSNRWSIAFSGTPKRLWFDDVEYRQIGATASIDSRSRWYYSSNVLWVYATENPSTAYASIKYPWTKPDYETVALLTNCDYIIMQSLCLRGGKMQIEGIGRHFTLDSCSLEYGASYGIYAVNTTTGCDSGIVRYCTIDYVDTLTHDDEYYQGNEDGLRLMTCRGWQIHNNIFRSWAHDCINIWAPSTGAYYAIDNRIFQNEFDGCNTDYGRAFDVNGVQGKMDSCYNNWFYQNYVHRFASRSQIGGRRTRVYYNWLDSLTYCPWQSDRRESAALNFVAYASVASDTVRSDSSIIANNTICLSGGTALSIGEMPAGCIADTFANNLIWYPAVGDTTALKGVGLWIPNHTEYLEGYAPGKIVAINNLFYGDSANVVKYRKWWNGYTDYTVDDDVATFNARSDSGDVIDNNVWGDPAFISASNRRLTSSSAARDVGVSLGFTVDYDGNSIAGIPDIGAFEYQPSSPIIKRLLKRRY